MAIRRQIVTLDITYEDSCATKPCGWDWHDLLDMSPEEGVKVVSSQVPEDGDGVGDDDDNPLDVPMTGLLVGAMLTEMAAKAPYMPTAGLYTVEQKSEGNESTDFGMFSIGIDGSVRWGDKSANPSCPEEWELKPYSAAGETPQSIGEMIAEDIRESVPEQYTEDGEIVVTFMPAD